MIDINILINSLLLLIHIANIANIHSKIKSIGRMISISLVKKLNGYSYHKKKKIMTEWGGGGGGNIFISGNSSNISD